MFRQAPERVAGVYPDNVISMRLGASGRQFPNREAAIEFFRQVGDRIAGLPGVKARGGVSALPFTSSVGWGRSMSKGGRLNPARNCRSINERRRRTTFGRWRFRWCGAFC